MATHAAVAIQLGLADDVVKHNARKAELPRLLIETSGVEAAPANLRERKSPSTKAILTGFCFHLLPDPPFFFEAFFAGFGLPVSPRQTAIM